jgi:hypothetical protein
MIKVSANASSSLIAAVNANPTTVDNPVGAARPAVQAETIQSTAVDPLLSPLAQTGDPPLESNTPARPVADSHAEMSCTTSALLRAEEAVDTMRTWNSAVEVVKRVMDAVSPIAEVFPISLLFIFILR